MSKTLIQSPIVKRVLHFAGSTLALIGIIFVGYRLHSYSLSLDFSRFNRESESIVAGLVVFYGMANILLAFAWWNLLEHFGARISRRWTVKAYGISQLAKYVPGNIFHLAGRQAIGMSAGLDGWVLAKSSLWELGLLAMVGGFFGLLAIPLVWSGLPVPISIVAFSLLLIAVFITLRRLKSYTLSTAFVWQIIFLVLSGIIFIIALGLIAPNAVTFSTFSLLCGAYITAWLAGFITPGSPAGLGVRELVLLFLLKGMVAEVDLLLTVVLGRLITVVGDLIYFTLCCFIPGEKNAS